MFYFKFITMGFYWAQVSELISKHNTNVTNQSKTDICKQNESLDIYKKIYGIFVHKIKSTED